MIPPLASPDAMAGDAVTNSDIGEWSTTGSIGRRGLLTVPPSDRLFRWIVADLIGALASEARSVRAVRRRLRGRYPSADLQRQENVLVRGVRTGVWFAYRDGRGAVADLASHQSWWTRPGVARAIVDSSGRLSQANAAWRALLSLPTAGRQRAWLRDVIPRDLCGDLARLSGRLEEESNVIAGGATAQLPSGQELEIEYRAVWNGAGPGRHVLTLLSFAERDQANHERAVRRSSLRLAPIAIQRDLLRSGGRDLAAGEALHESVGGEPWAALVISGIVRLHGNVGGHEPTYLYATCGRLLGTHWAPPGESLPLGLQSVTPSRITPISPAGIRRLMETDSAFGRGVLRESQQAFHDLIQALAMRSTGTLAQRLADEILKLKALQGGTLVAVTEQQLADGIGSIRESVGRAIADFRRSGWLATTRHGVIILDPDALGHVAGLGPD